MFRQIRGFGDYGFPESHAASFALLVYVSAWLKHHYPAAFTAALLNSQPMGFYAPAQLVRNAREHGVEVLPVDVNFQRVGMHVGGKGKAERRKGGEADEQGESIEPAIAIIFPFSPPLPLPFSLRLGFNMLLGMSAAHVERIEQARQRGAVPLGRRFRPPHRSEPRRDRAAGQGGNVRLARNSTAAPPCGKPSGKIRRNCRCSIGRGKCRWKSENCESR